MMHFALPRQGRVVSRILKRSPEAVLCSTEGLFAMTPVVIPDPLSSIYPAFYINIMPVGGSVLTRGYSFLNRPKEI